MSRIEITLKNGRRIEYELDEEGSGPPCFLLSVRKCGSTLANSICRALVKFNERCYVDVGGSFFRNNIVARDWQRDPALNNIVRPGVIYGGFREAPLAMFDAPEFIRARKIIVIRDPRDALVSEYFSNAYSHPVPQQTGEHDAVAKLILQQRELATSGDFSEYILKRARDMARTFEGYGPVLAMPNTLLLKYEDVIFNKMLLIDAFVRQFDLKTHPQVTKSILEWADKRPETENPKAFVRQVTPGDHKRKLTPETIAKLNEQLGEAMDIFGYSA